MKFRKQRGQFLSLALSAHPLSTVSMTIAVTVAAALTGRPAEECALVAVTIFSGQLTVGWLNDVVDRHRDKEVGVATSPSRWGGSTRRR